MTSKSRDGTLSAGSAVPAPRPGGWRLPEDHVGGLLAGLFHSAPSGVAVVDPDGQVLAANPALAAASGRSVHAIVGRPWRVLLHPDDWALDDQLMLQASEGPEPISPVEARVVRPDGTNVWVLLSVNSVHDEQGRLRFTDSSGHALYFLRLVTEIGELKQVEAELVAHAGRDPLTDLPNRGVLLDHLAHAIRGLRRESGRVAVLYLDLDRFKVINDSLGHAAGDDLLRVVADRIAGMFRPGDMVARLGGDEFVVAFTTHAHQAARNIVTAAERVRKALHNPIPLGERELFTTASIGIASTDDPAAAPEILLRDADTAMYVAKHHGGDRFELFDAALRTAVVDRLELEHDLRAAIDDGRLTIAYQPIVQLDDGIVVAVEALVRWSHPHRGLLQPDAFIPLAEEIGLIRPLDTYVLERACVQGSDWHERFGDAAPAVRVNLSAQTLVDPALADHVTDCLQRTRLPPTLLCFEITETALIAEPTVAAAAIRALRAKGIRFAVDDFGTRYASLSYLMRFPLDMLKIDRSFVAGVDTNREQAAIVAAIISLARALDLTVTAEGVETQAQRDKLQQLGARNGQGWLWGRPGTAQQLEYRLSS